MVEFAVTAPILFMLIFACFEFSRVNMYNNTVEIAAAEGARVGTLPGATASQCIATANAELAVLGIKGQTVTVSPSVIDSTTTTVRVDISVPLTAKNGFAVTPFFVGRSVKNSVELSID